jgi:asparagine synthase (glutamine-hydrolysing)
VCGIAGIIYHDRHRPVRLDQLKRMAGALFHRGPDDEGFYVDGNAGLAVRRLEVIDLVTGHQPIPNEDGSIWIVFNGEIYNYLELRKELEDKGHTFSTDTDTETIVHLYEEYGQNCVSRLSGMFAFAILDRRERKIVLARDRLGVKPLYYFLNDRCLVFGSELKALRESREVPSEIDLEAVDSYFALEYIPSPLSILRNVRKLPPAHILIYQDGKTALHEYWVVEGRPVVGDEAQLAETLYTLITDSVRMRLMSDVPLGAFLSGGIDSSTIVSVMSSLMARPVKTFSVGFDDLSYNELPYARTVARHLGTDHYEVTMQSGIVNSIERLVWHLDEPLADVSIFPTFLVSQLAKQHVTVVLSGDGGDELFAGYDWYVADRIDQYYRSVPGAARTRWIPWLMDRLPPTEQKRGLINSVKRFVEGSILPEQLQHFRWNIFITPDVKKDLYSEDLKRSIGTLDPHHRPVSHFKTVERADRLWQQQYADIKTYLADDILFKVDRMSMANSLEVRTPYLDHRMVEFAAGLRSRLRLRGLRTKYLLKLCMASRLPREILTRRKEGLSVPMKTWLRGELRPLLELVLSPDRIQEGGLFNVSFVERLKSEHLKGTANHSHRLWSLMIFEIWREQHRG